MGTYSYDPTMLSASEVYQLRLIVGDTDPQAWLMADQEYSWALQNERNTWSAAARMAEQIGFLFTRKVDTKLGRSAQIVYSKTAAAYFNLAKWLRQKSNGTVVPYIGGAYAGDYQAIATNTGLNSAFFLREMQQNPWTGGYSPDALTPPTNNAPVDTTLEDE